MKKRITMLCVCMILAALLTGCFVPIAWDPVFYYDGEYKDLVATAIYSVPGARSDSDDQVLVLEEDSYGRILYAVFLNGSWLVEHTVTDGLLAVLVMQKSDESNVWFYPEQNYQIHILEERETLDEKLVQKHFEDQTIARLKAENKWEEAPAADDAALWCAPLDVEKAESLSDSAERAVEKEIGTNTRSVLLREDSRGNEVYFVLKISGYEWYAVMLDQDGALKNGRDSICRLSSLEEMPQQLAEFMNANGWTAN